LLCGGDVGDLKAQVARILGTTATREAVRGMVFRLFPRRRRRRSRCGRFDTPNQRQERREGCSCQDGAPRVRGTLGTEKKEAMTRNVDPRQAGTTLVERYGHEAAAAYVVKRITELNDQGSMYELSIWREVRKAIADLTNEADRVGEPDDDR
jgi:hypothetical protein